jgi:hypothetical protein
VLLSELAVMGPTETVTFTVAGTGYMQLAADRCGEAGGCGGRGSSYPVVAAADEAMLLPAARLNRASQREVRLSKKNATVRALELVDLTENMGGGDLVDDDDQELMDAN